MSDDNTLDNELIYGIQGEQGDQGERGPRGEQGEEGAQGPKGLRGAQGTQGPQGEPGYQGYRGYQGSQGQRGFKGMDGAAGAQGSQGSQGLRGATGAQGIRGAKGMDGAQGMQGLTGEAGFRGPAGAQGMKGETGITGAQGITGDAGSQGPRGAQGEPGPDGIDGIQGAQGGVGKKGSQGPQGVQGEQGPQGDIGFQGLQGERGAQGEDGPKGVTGIRGARGLKGDQGAQGYRGCDGAQGPRGGNGVQGPQGARGEYGAQGARGEIGPQGKKGSRGFPGTQGERGEPGIQGARGCDGAQGAAGENGKQGPQGLRGDAGAQGTRGCNGAQGAAGMKGVQGPQGTRGNIGAQGHRGIQGLQGPTGPKGKTGVMGYQGPAGDVGIQGVQGEEAGIWHDGIRLNGYNTHLFVYETEKDKFIPILETPDKREHNLLYIKNGAVIKIWIDRTSFNFINNNGGRIKIDTYAPGQETEDGTLTQFIAYYAGTTLLTQKITEDDFNGVIELTFKDDVEDVRDGAWYYSGGLIGVVTKTTDSIIKVNGVNIGGYSSGDSIPAGTEFETIFRTMLNKTIDVVAILPKASKRITGTPANIVEIGSRLSFTMIMEYTNGYFQSSDKDLYSDIDFNRINNTTGGKLPAGCRRGTDTFKLNGSTIASGVVTNLVVNEQIYNYTGNVSYGASTNIAKMSDGNNSNVRIDASSINVNLLSFTGCYKCFFGFTETNPTLDYSEVFTTQASLNTLNNQWLNGDTYVGTYDSDDDTYKMSSILEHESLVVVIPEYFYIFSTKNSLDSPIPVNEKWIKQNDLFYTNENKTTKYEVYVLHSNIPIMYKEILLKRKNL